MRTLSLLHLNSARKYVGEAAHSLELCRALSQRGHRVLLAVRSGCVLERRARDAGLEVLPLRMKSSFSPIADLSDVRAIIRECRGRQVDIMHAHRGKDHWLAAGAKLLGGLPLRLARTRHGLVPIRNHLANRWLAARTDIMLCVSDAVGRSVAASGVYPDDRLRVIPAGVDTTRWRPARSAQERADARRLLGIAEDAQVVVCVSRFHPAKGHAYILAGLELLLKRLPRTLALFVGEGSGPDAMEPLARDRGLGDAARFLGWREDVPEILRAADAGLLASVKSEDSGLALMEYMASGLPVVATRVGAVPEFVSDGESGILVGIRSPAAIADALAAVLGDPTAARRMGEHGRRLAEERFSLDTWVDRTEACYGEIVDGAPEEPRAGARAAPPCVTRKRAAAGPSGTFSIECVAGYEDIRLESIPWGDEAALRAMGAKTVKDSGDRGVVALDRGPAGRVYCKRYTAGSLRKLLSSALLGSRAGREWRAAMAAAATGIEVARPVALAERRRMGIPVESVIASAGLDLPDLGSLWRNASSNADRRALTVAAGVFVRAMHDSGLYHDDLAAKHVLCRRSLSGWEFALIDLMGSAVKKTTGAFARATNLYQIMRSLSRHGLGPGGRLRVLKAYLTLGVRLDGCDRGELRLWWRRVRRVRLLKCGYFGPSRRRPRHPRSHE